MRILKFEMETCAPCKTLQKTLNEMNISIPINPIDVKVYPSVAKEYGVRSVPTMVITDNEDHMIRKVTGALSKEQITEFLGEYNYVQ